MKDRFSDYAGDYAVFRPSYPDGFFQYLQTILPATDRAWDCGTGNGQVAQKLSVFFKEVYATDISAAQLQQAPKLPNVFYSVQPAEQAQFPNNYFDLVVVAQAIHWFDFEKFYAAVRRTAKPKALIAVLGYGKLRVDKAVDAVIDDFYHNIIGPYWDAERRYVDEGYQTIPFPFKPLPAPTFNHYYEWTMDRLLGYLNTWSAVKQFQKKNNHNPLSTIRQSLATAWGGAPTKKLCFPVLTRMGWVHLP